MSEQAEFTWTPDMSVPNESIQDFTDEELAQRRDVIRRRLSELSRATELHKAERAMLDEEFLRRFDERHSQGTKTEGWTIFVREDLSYPDLYDIQAFEDYIRETGNLYLLQRRISITNLEEEFKAGRDIPGIRRITKRTVNQRKR